MLSSWKRKGCSFSALPGGVTACPLVCVNEGDHQQCCLCVRGWVAASGESEILNLLTLLWLVWCRICDIFLWLTIVCVLMYIRTYVCLYIRKYESTYVEERLSLSIEQGFSIECTVSVHIHLSTVWSLQFDLKWPFPYTHLCCKNYLHLVDVWSVCVCVCSIRCACHVHWVHFVYVICNLFLINMICLGCFKYIILW